LEQLNLEINRFRSSLIGRTIKDFRLAGNSLIIYIDCTPGENYGFVIWFEPTWHYVGPKKVLVGSRQVQQDEYDELGIKEALDQLNLLVGKKVIDLKIEERSNDLVTLIEGDFYIKTFVSDPTDDWIWQIKDKDAKLRLHGDPYKITLLTDTEET
jgi:hypothetical protein